MTNTTFLTRRRALQWAAAASASSALTVFGQSDWPQGKAVTFVVPFTAGSGTDVIARTIAEKLGPLLGAQIVIDNKTGAGGTVGAALVAKAPADGYTLLIVAPDLAINQSLIAKLPYTVEDFAPVTLAAWSPMVLALNPTLKINTPKELVDYARAKPNALRFASGGNGTGSHLALELFKSKAAVNIIHVPYRGVGPATTDLLGGQVDGMFLQMAIAKRHAVAGKLQAIATPSPSRVQAMADVPTLSETVVPGFDVVPWFGVVAPAGTPAPIIQRLHTELQAILASPEVKTTLSDQGAEAVSVGPEPFGRFIRSEVNRWAEVIKQSGVKVD